jgi:peptidyl-dipeptidase Dcp
MKKNGLIVLLLAIFFAACRNESKKETTMNENPFFEKWDTPYGLPPFDKIKEKHYLPAFEKAMELQNKEIDAIVHNKEKPNFENTIVALDKSGAVLRKVSSVFLIL